MQQTVQYPMKEVEVAFHAYETAREQIRAYEEGLLKQADESRDIQFAAYQEGATELITLIEAQRTRTEVRANYYRAMLDFYTSIFNWNWQRARISNHEHINFKCRLATQAGINRCVRRGDRIGCHRNRFFLVASRETSKDRGSCRRQ